jgi:undecaprenyl-diphosphatase
MSSLNLTLFLTLNAGDSPDPAMLGFARIVATYLIAIAPIKLCLDWFRGGEARKAAFVAFAAILLGLALNQAIGWLTFFPRPAMIAAGRTYLAFTADSSFPSDHATVLFCAAAAYQMRRRHGSATLLAMAGVIVGWARIYLGVHFPLDVLGAACLALPVGLVASFGVDRIGSPALRLAETIYRALFSPLIKRGWIRS